MTEADAFVRVIVCGSCLLCWALMMALSLTIRDNKVRRELRWGFHGVTVLALVLGYFLLSHAIVEVPQ